LELIADKTHEELSPHLIRELRSDHAGETGAVYIYRGITAIARLYRDQELLDFAKHHGDTEMQHLALIENWLEPSARSRLLGPWRVAGWLTGAIPALFGRKAVYATIDAVETFVERHYQQQIDYLAKQGGNEKLFKLLIRCQADETAHKNEAQSKISSSAPLALRAWCAMVGSGSAAAVLLARRI
jgi:ubiquinone biosynthesis monooxygenase Coq7